jgi:hypothetical protein
MPSLRRRRAAPVLMEPSPGIYSPEYENTREYPDINENKTVGTAILMLSGYMQPERIVKQCPFGRTKRSVMVVHHCISV